MSVRVPPSVAPLSRVITTVLVSFGLAHCRGPRPDEPAVTFDAAVSDTVSSPTARPQDRVRIATFNAHRYFDTVCDTGQCAPGDYEEQPTPEEFARKTAILAFAIARLDADTVLLQEVEDDTALFALRDALGPDWRTAVMGETNSPGSVDVAVLSRDTVVDVRRHRSVALSRPDGTPTLFAREFLETELDHAGHRVIVFCAHFRSMVGDDPGRREAEARAARQIVTARAELSPSALVVMGGDLNDTPGSVTLDALLSGGELFRVASVLPEGEDKTWGRGPSAVAFDHLLVAVRASGELIPNTVSVRWDAPPARGYGGSDHAALVAGFGL